MRDRGETVADIAHLGGCSVKLVRRYLNELHRAAPVSGTTSGKVPEHQVPTERPPRRTLRRSYTVAATTPPLRSNHPPPQLVSEVIRSVEWRHGFRARWRAPALAVMTLARFRNKIVGPDRSTGLQHLER